MKEIRGNAIMRHERIKPPNVWLAAVLVMAASVVTLAQNAQNQGAQPPAQTNAPAQPPQADNLATQLGFTPQQFQQWREINREFGPQQKVAEFKLRQSRQALNEAMESASPNEEVIKQRAKDVADAQSAVTQIQALRQARVLQMLTPEQRVKLKEIRERAQTLRRNEQRPNALAPGRGLNRNANVNLLTPAQRKALRQQQPPKPKP
jgi:Spy/CpxP family protein refolding chaperone